MCAMAMEKLKAINYNSKRIGRKAKAIVRYVLLPCFPMPPELFLVHGLTLHIACAGAGLGALAVAAAAGERPPPDGMAGRASVVEQTPRR